MKNHRIITTGLLLMAGMLVAGLYGQSPRQGRTAHRQARYIDRQERMAPDRVRMATGRERTAIRPSLDLTEEQQETLKTLNLEHYQKMKPLNAKMAELRATERTLLSEEEVDLNAVHKTIDEQTALMNEISKLKVEHKINTEAVLTDEQVMKLDQRRNFSKQRRINGNDFGRAPRRGRPYSRNVG